ncbi:DNA polymerase III subunit gamma and tau [Pseudarthrobacter psychrotolerans]|uniref:DNA polymerase III subunit gamma/tau n=1 Tax=Pseudarthrobacter psychrotolerans TaxID=2697569 RepID=A0A6P1NQL0_9MICC|nr:DNA polymerase III subunit gamma and tau [Pseudarthrobacter psychrotolerans]QHK21468.1 DNA polymerase III subunit gamma and tau [Pseudarthrobacter psychrotolerans]
MTVTTTALYRRYRPDSFADVIGQEHVTEPLMTALRKNRVNHAYLFSGPRGCGKTTSARILARCLNCAEGPTDTPCGTCPSCIELARGGSGSLDVIEIDAASHGGVDDARDLRERATYAPVRDRYKIFIIDEAHMVTSAGFNALLKIVEEPPEHIKFIFATTEPDKVIGTIRSRTHHYPFRLVPPEPLMAYLELLCNQENVPVAPGVLSLVVRAGGGSVRDSLSVLDQLMAGAGPHGLDYELAVALLGYTHASLLDDVVEAVAASDAATVFRAVDRVVQTGHDPRRFVEDLLERFRDLIIVQAMPESAQVILRGMPADQIARLQNQAHNLGASELSRAADVTNTALTEMTGATSPRLHLELLCARILLPSSEQTERGIAARIDRVERRLNYAGNDVGAPAPAGAAVAAVPAAALQVAAAPAGAPVAGPPVSAAPVAVPPVSAPPVSEAPAAALPVASVPAAAPQVAAAPVAAQQPSAPAAAGTESARPRSAGTEEARPPLTPPRVSTDDWPVDESTGRRPASTPQATGQPARETMPDAAREVPPAARPANTDPVPVTATAAPVPAAPASAGDAPASPAPTGAIGTEAASTVAANTRAAATVAAGTGDVEVLRRAWPEVLQTLSKIKRSTWALVEPNSQVGAFDGQVLTLSFSTTGLAGAFGRADHSENLRQAIHKTVGIDCQITAVAGGANSVASAEPNPKAPASPEAPASSADVAWGLAPASAVSTPIVHATAPAPSPAPSPATRAPEPAVPPAIAEPSVPTATAAPSAGAAGPAETVQYTGAVSAPAATESAQVPDAQGPSGPAEPEGIAGSYAYSDDDWGPPRDEDAPPLDEEPPMDWDPSASAAPRPSEPEPSAAAPAKRSARSAPKAAAAKTSPAARSSAAASAVPPSQPDTALDPWGRAVEQAPGVWVVGTEPNVGKSPSTSVPEEAASAAPAPSYEPATAQVPQPSPVVSQSEADASWGLPPAAAAATSDVAAPQPAASQGPARETAAPHRAAPTGEAPSAPVVPAWEAVVPEPAETREYAMASAAPTAAPLQPAPATSESAAAARQSLYQRLSNSPEAEAGRAKAPARAAAATYVQDIPSADDETIEESGVFGRAAVERILGGKLIEERSPDGSPLVSKF